MTRIRPWDALVASVKGFIRKHRDNFETYKKDQDILSELESGGFPLCSEDEDGDGSLPKGILPGLLIVSTGGPNGDSCEGEFTLLSQSGKVYYYHPANGEVVKWKWTSARGLKNVMKTLSLAANLDEEEEDSED